MLANGKSVILDGGIPDASADAGDAWAYDPLPDGGTYCPVAMKTGGLLTVPPGGGTVDGGGVVDGSVDGLHPR